MTQKMRVAWFSPLPPIRSGISRYSAELLPAISSTHQVDLFVDGPPAAFVSPDPQIRLFDALDFVWMNRRRAYDLIVYQLGNAPCHDYMWAYLVRYPGLVVLHDAQLHHARGRALLQQKRYDDYRREFWFNHPDAAVDLAELGAAGLLGSLTNFLPMLRVAIESARHVAVHNLWLADQLRETYPATTVTSLKWACPRVRPARMRATESAGVMASRQTSVLFVAFGKVTPEKRIVEAVRGLAAMSAAVPDAHLLLAGESVDYYDPIAVARDMGVGDRVLVAGFVPDDELDRLSGRRRRLFVHALADLARNVGLVPAMPGGRSSDAHDGPCSQRRHSYAWTHETEPYWAMACRSGPASTYSTSRTRSISRCDGSPQDARLREALGRQARELWAKRFRLEQMIAGYRTTIDSAATAPLPREQQRRELPAHLLADGREHGARLLLEAGFPDSVVDGYLDT